jgi:hypothetical protein
MLRGFFRLVFAILLGVVGTLAWQSYGEEAKATIRTWGPTSGLVVSSLKDRTPRRSGIRGHGGYVS